MQTFLSDSRYAIRMFARSPGTTVVAVFSLALAIGPNTALFSVVDHMVLRATPVAGAPLYYLQTRTDEQGKWESPSYPDLLDYRTQAGTLASFLATESHFEMVNRDDRNEMVAAAFVTENFFSALGLKAAAGRLLTEDDAHLEAVPPVVLSYSLWQEKFGGAREIIGKTILLTRHAYHVAGVGPRGFGGVGFQLFPTELWIPFSAASATGRYRDLMQRGKRHIRTIVRLHDGVERSRAETALTAVAAHLAEQYPDSNHGKAAALIPADDPGKKLLALIVLSVAGLVLLIACANVAGVLLAKGEMRRHEFAVRLAVGAGRGRLVRQLVTETLLLAVIAGALGIAAAEWLIRALPALMPAIPLPIRWELALDGRVLLYASFLSVVTTVAAGLLPALRASGQDLAPALKGEAPAAGVRLGARTGLVAAQVAFSQFLLVGTGLLARSYLEVRQIRPGFDPDRNVLLAALYPTDEAGAREYAPLTGTLRALPGVVRVSSAAHVPFSGSGDALRPIFAPELSQDPIQTGWNTVGADYFRIMGTRLLQGRSFAANEARSAVVVNEYLARQVWGSADAAIGKFFRTENTRHQVIGVVENGKYSMLLEAARPFVFVPFPETGREGTILVETAGPPRALVESVRKAIQAAAPHYHIGGLVTLRRHMDLAYFPFRLGAGTLGALALLGILLAGVGLYGMVAYSVSRRAHEFGVRAALGAQPRDVLRLVMRQSLAPVALGAAAGLGAALAAARVLGAALYHVSPADPVGVLAATAVVLVVALFAARIPARRAVRADPMVVLRRT
jgi:predicted permease